MKAFAVGKPDGMAFFGITSLGPPNIFDLYRWLPRA